VARFPSLSVGDFTDPVPDGTYCYAIAVGDDESTAVGPGLTVVVSTGTLVPAGTTSAVPSPLAPAAPSESAVAAADTSAPDSPARLRSGLARRAGAPTRVTLRWTNPAVADLDHVELVTNSRHRPRSRVDGHLAYRGVGQTFTLALLAGRTTYVALYAVDRSGNVSGAARIAVSLPPLTPLRPFDGSAVAAPPLLRWKPRSGAAYYNLQVFQRGKRVLVAWPKGSSYRLPAGVLRPGTSVWYVWPAYGSHHASPRFGSLIGRATFVYAG
jgi:hypothetical protein